MVPADAIALMREMPVLLGRALCEAIEAEESAHGR